MRIGFIGNTNNYPFMLAMAIERLGHQIVFIVDSSEKLHRPEFFATPTELSKINIHYFPNLITSFSDFIISKPSLKEVENILRECDVLIVNGLWPILARRLKKPYLCLITGSDLEYYGDPLNHVKSYWSLLKDCPPLKRFIRVLGAGIISQMQFNAISHSTAYNYFAKGLIPNGDRLLEKMSRPKRLCFMMSDTTKIRQTPLPNNKIVRILCVARHEWTLPLKPGKTLLDLKGNDIFLKGVSIFCRRNNASIEVILVKKGSDVEASKKLINDLKIDDKILWLEEMSQKDLIIECEKSDIIVDQFSESVVAMAGLDAMAMGRPLIANGRPEIFRPLIGEASPICQASDPEEVAKQLEKLMDERTRSKVGNLSRSYVEKFFSSNYAAKICLKAISDE